MSAPPCGKIHHRRHWDAAVFEMGARHVAHETRPYAHRRHAEVDRAIDTAAGRLASSSSSPRLVRSSNGIALAGGLAVLHRARPHFTRGSAARMHTAAARPWSRSADDHRCRTGAPVYHLRQTRSGSDGSHRRVNTAQSPAAHHQYLHDAALARGDHGADCRRLRTYTQRIRRVLDITSGVNTATGAAKRGADRKTSSTAHARFAGPAGPAPEDLPSNESLEPWHSVCRRDRGTTDSACSVLPDQFA